MHVTNASPEKLFSWFHEKQSQAEVLCLLLPRDHNDEASVASILQTFLALDITMGAKIALIVPFSGPDPVKESNVVGLPGPGTGTFFAGRIVLPCGEDNRLLALRDVPGLQRREAFEMVREQTLRIVPEYVHALKLEQEGPDLLPALITFVRGDSRIMIVPLRHRWSLDTINSFLVGLSRAVSSEPALRLPQYIASTALTQIERLILRAELMRSRIDGYRQAISDKVDALERRGYEVPETARTSVMRMLSEMSLDLLDDVFNRWTIPSGQREFFRVKLRAIDRVQCDLQKLLNAQLPRQDSYREWEVQWVSRKERIEQHTQQAARMGILVRKYDELLSFTQSVPWQRFAEFAKLVLRAKTVGTAG